MGLVSHFRLNGDARDSVGNNHGDIFGSPQWSDGKFGTCLDLTTSYGPINLIQSDVADSFKFCYSWSLWFMSTSTTSSRSNNRILSRDCSDYMCVICNQSSDPNILQSSDGAFTYQVETDTWYHLAVTTEDGISHQWYVNGSLEGTSNENMKGSKRPWVLAGNTEGGDPRTSYDFDGKIDDVRIYDHALSQREVRDLYNGTILHVVPNPQSPVDSSGNDYTITPYNVQYTQESPVGGGSYYFDGNAGTYLDCTNQVFRNHDYFSVSLWFRRQTDQTAATNHSVHNVLLAKSSTAHNDNFELGTDGGSIEAYFDAGSSNSTQNIPASITNNQWYHLVLTYDQGSLDVYLDGQNLGVYDVGGPLDTSADPSPFAIGESQHEGAPFHGDITDVRLFATVLSPDYVQELYQQRTSIDGKGTLHVNELKDSGWTEDFSSGNLDNWTVHDSDFEIKTDNVYSGQYSAGIESSSAKEDVAERIISEDGVRPDSLSFYFYELADSYGGGIRLFDTDNNLVVGVATDNPEWDIPDSNGNMGQIGTGGGYKKWVYVELSFDWTDGQYEYIFEDMDNGSIENGINGMASDKDIKILTISNYNGSSGWSSGIPMYMWFDNITISPNPFVSLSEQGTFSGNFSEVGPADGLVAWYPLIGDTQDYAGNNDGTNNGATPVANGYEFSTSEQFEISPFDIGVSLENESYSFWMKGLTDMSEVGGGSFNEWFIGMGSYAKANNLGLGIQSGRIRAYMNGASGATWTKSPSIRSANSLYDSGWMHVCIVIKGNNIVEFYFNSELLRTSDMGDDGFSEYSSDNIRFLKRIKGLLSDVRIYNRALTEQEITTLYNMTKDNGPLVSMTDTTINTANEIKEVIA